MVRRYEKVRHMSTDRSGATMLVKRDETVLLVLKTIDIGRFEKRDHVLTEVRHLASIRHPNVVAVHECFLEGGHLCLVTEYADAGHVAGRVEKACLAGTQIAESLYLKWFSQAALGLSHIHSCGCTHGDLRTRRLLLHASGHAVLSGLMSTTLGTTVKAEALDIETVRYMSPELLRGGTVCKASDDLWALGVLLYEMATLKHLFDDPQVKAFVQRVLNTPIQMLPSRCSEEVRQMCTGLTQRHPASRPHASQLLQGSVAQDTMKDLFNGATLDTYENMYRPAGRNLALPKPILHQGPSSHAMLISPAESQRALRPIERPGYRGQNAIQSTRATLHPWSWRAGADNASSPRVASACDSGRFSDESPFSCPASKIAESWPDTNEIVSEVIKVGVESHLMFTPRLSILGSDLVEAAFPLSKNTTTSSWNLPPIVHSREFPKFDN